MDTRLAGMRWAVFFILSSCFILACDGEDPPEPPPDTDVFFTALPSFISSDNARVDFAWIKTSSLGTWSALLRLYDTDDNFLALLGQTTVNLSSPGASSITGNFRYTPGGIQRSIPVPPGQYRLEVRILDWRSERRGIQVVANGWDTDGDDISNAVEDENNGVTGMQTPIIDENGNTQHGWYVRTNGNLPPMIPTTIPIVNRLYPNRGTHDYSLAEGTRGSGCLYNGLRIADQSSGYNGVIILITGTNYDQSRSQQLMQMLDALPTVYRIWTSDEIIANISTTDKIQFQDDHVNHFHVDFVDPDGNQSCQ